MHHDAVMALSPLLILAGTAIVVLLASAFCRSHRLAVGLTLAGLAAAFAALAVAWPHAPRLVTALLVIDRFALFYMGMIIAATFAVVMFAHDYLETNYGPVGADAESPTFRREEFYVLLLLAATGAAVLVASVHFASFFLGLELLSVALYALVAYRRENGLGIEAGVKYLILGGTSSAFLLFGMALVYAALGSLEFAGMAHSMTQGAAGGLLPLAGVALMIVGVGFKLSVVPFHGWAPDVYQGASAPATAFVATVSKGAVFALLLRFFGMLQVPRHGSVATAVALLAVASMFAGNWLALLQSNVKRMLAYSSIAHMGYLLVALLAVGAWAPIAVACYLTAYFVTTLGAFGVVAALSPRSRDADVVEDYRSLAWRRPWTAGVFTAMLLSLAGIPLTIGFIGKFTVLAAGVSSNLWLLVVVLVINSVIGLFYYLRLIAVMYRLPAEGTAVVVASPLPQMSRAALFILTLALVALGAYPAPLIRVIQACMAP